MTVILTEDETAMVAELRRVRSAKKDLEAREKELRAAILQRVGEADRALTASGEPAVRLRRRIRRTVNSAQLEALYPEIYDEVMTESEVVTLELG